jgi:anti-anti-sigma factor
MSLRYEITSDRGKVVLILRDRVVHEDRGAFDRVVREVLANQPGEVEVDFHDLSYMDSAGLGFLLTLREQARKAGSSVVLSKPTGTVREILDLARFETLFTIR